jgi:THO complex subunit 2
MSDLLRCLRQGIGGGPDAAAAAAVAAASAAGSPSSLASADPAAAAAARLSSELLEILREQVLPALSLCGSSASLSHEAWTLVRALPWPLRFELYSFLKDRAPTSHPALHLARARAQAAARQAMKRVAHETLRQSGRMIAKVALSNPCVALDCVVSSLESYDNLIPLATEALKYIGPLAMDVAAFVIVDHLHTQRERTKADGMTPADWLQSLALFVGQFYRKYHHVEIGALLHSVVRSLTGLGDDDAGTGTDIERLIKDLPVLLMFRQLITRMCGIEVVENATEEQLEACGGSESLRNQFLSRTLVVGPAPWTVGTPAARIAPKITEAIERIVQLNSFKRAIARLRDTLILGYGGGPVAMPLLVLLAQQQDLVLFGKPKGPLTAPPGFDINSDADVEAWPIDFDPPSSPPPPLKVVGARYDDVHATLMLFADLLRVHALPTAVSYSSMCPAIGDLLTVYRLQPALAWLIARPAIRCASYPGLVDGAADTNPGAAPLLDVVVAAASGASASEGAASSAQAAIARSVSHRLSIFNPDFVRQLEPGLGGVAAAAAAAATAAAAVAAAAAATAEAASSGDGMEINSPNGDAESSRSVWFQAHITPELYCFFWAHCLYDIGVPTAGYEKAALALKEAVAALDAAAPNPSTIVSPADLRAKADRDRVRNRYLEAAQRLRNERPAQEAHVRRVAAGLAALRDRLLLPLPDKKAALGAIMQHCVLPRALLSPEDALYSARFLLLMHSTGVPCFITATVLERIVSQVSPHLLACTEAEADCLGVLLA